MLSDLSAVKIKENVYWVGAIDWNVRNFHGYTTDRGTTYNAYLVIDEKITLFDTVKKGFGTELLERVASVIDPSDIDYIVSNHAEPDHSGELSHVMEKVSPEKVFASKMGVKALTEHYPELEGRVEPVENEGILSLGEKSVKFMETKMIHWPDSMFSYLVEDALLISQDAFGMHLASGERFDDMLPSENLFNHAAGYYANIVTLYSPQISRLLKKVEEMDLKIDIIAPDHGPVWRKSDNIAEIISLYKQWSSRKISPKLVVFYDTMWHSTEKMARYIEDAALSSGIKVVSISLSSSDRSEIATEMLDAAAVAVGSPTMN
ncbi:MAG: FprA family A-type flavoprotein, partial [bacterium]